jgi:DNA repair exonuclease SbcCD ATPase subunit
MRKLSPREKVVLEALDEEIEELEAKLQKVQPLFDELQRLRKARSVMLDERSTTGKPRGKNGGGAQMETIITYLREHATATTTELAEYVGTTVPTIRAHLNRYKDERYHTDGNGTWSLIGTDRVDEEDDDEADED